MRCKFRISIICITLSVLLSSCGKPTADFEVSYDVVGTKYNQYFAVTAGELLPTLNEHLSDAGLSLSVKESGNDRSTYYSENGDTWKIIARVFSEDDIDVSKRSNASEDPNTWVGYIYEIELSLFSNSEEMAKRNGEYIRALIKTFTPGAETIVEDELGLYGEPNSKVEVTPGVYRITMENVSYVYVADDKFVVQPLDSELYTKLNEPEQNVIKPA